MGPRAANFGGEIQIYLAQSRRGAEAQTNAKKPILYFLCVSASLRE
jgi:hypothetical protein